VAYISIVALISSVCHSKVKISFVSCFECYVFFSTLILPGFEDQSGCGVDTGGAVFKIGNKSLKLTVDFKLKCTAHADPGSAPGC
jgi:hypothetical protein